MEELQTLDKPRKGNVKLIWLWLGLLSLAILAVFIDQGLCSILGPLMAAFLMYLYFGGYAEFVTAIIVVANDSLGTIIGGSLSFPYLLLAMVVVRIVLRPKLQQSALVYLLVALVLIMQPLFTDSLSFRGALYSFVFILSLLVLPNNEESRKKLFCGIAYTVVLIALHACITGGVKFYDLAEGSEEVLRKGVLGVGSGDANFSSYLLLIGIVCLCYIDGLKIGWKLACIGVLLYAVMITLSITGLLALLATSLMGTLLSKKKKKALIILIVIAIIVVALFDNYAALPAAFRNEALDGYIVRVEEKMLQFQMGDYSGATTGRSYLAKTYLAYIFNQPVMPLLFGGNGLFIINNKIAHNTFLSLLLQVGLVGAGALVAWMIWKLRKLLRCPATKANRNQVLVLKGLSVLFAFTLSIYNGNMWALWFYFLVVL